MQLKDLHYFARAAELGNLHAAAESLGLTQPALSKAIRRLETGLSVVLLERTARGVAATAAGLALLARSREFAQLEESTRSEIRDLKTGQTGELRIGCVPAIVEPVLTPVLASFLADGLPVRFQAHVQLSGMLLQQLEVGELDFAIAAVSPSIAPSLNCMVLGQQRSYVVARTGHPLLRRRFERAELAQQPWVLPPANISLRAWVESALAACGASAPIAFLQADASPAVFASLVRMSNALTVMTTDSLRGTMGKGLRALPPPAPDWELQIGLFWRRTAYFSASMKTFRERVAAAFASAARR
jgi:DNA-binding transcriptional LysR family regulator